ncbi:unnamed protein product [Rotaria sordida]|uniref:Uncharacterized protein n=1 Tax=Rotaria sordida TaxID=392033 RepID=A0A815SYZ0_9BILA|nr:unnamed protein product [Rotaria sordida]
MRFDDLLPIVNQRKISNAIIKIDIETSEHFFISNRTNLILEFFLNRHYIPYDSETCHVNHKIEQIIFYEIVKIFFELKKKLYSFMSGLVNHLESH